MLKFTHFESLDNLWKWLFLVVPFCVMHEGDASTHKMNTKYNAVCTWKEVQYFTQARVPVPQLTYMKVKSWCRGFLLSLQT